MSENRDTSTSLIDKEVEEEVQKEEEGNAPSSSTPAEKAIDSEWSEKMTEKSSGESSDDDREKEEKIKDSEIKPEDEEERAKDACTEGNPKETATETEGSEKMKEKPSGDDREGGEKIADSEVKVEDDKEKAKQASTEGNIPSSSTPLMETATETEGSGRMIENFSGEDLPAEIHSDKPQGHDETHIEHISQLESG